MSTIWLVFIYLGLSWAVALLGEKRGLGFGLSFGMSIAISPLFGLLFVFIRTRQSHLTSDQNSNPVPGAYDTAEKQAAYFREKAKLEQRIADLERAQSNGSGMNYDNEISYLKNQINNLRY